MLYKNQNLTYSNHPLPYTLTFFSSVTEKLKDQQFEKCVEELKAILNSEGGTSWLIEEVKSFARNNNMTEGIYLQKLELALIINIQIKMENFLKQKQSLALTKDQEDWLNSSYAFHETSLHIWFKTLTKQPYPWDINPNYGNKDLQERLEYNVTFLKKVWDLILYLDIALYDNQEKLENHFQLKYDNSIDLFTMTFVNRLDRIFKECLVKYQEYSIPKTITYTKTGILFLDKDKFAELSPRKKTSILNIMNRRQQANRPELDLIERVAYSLIKRGDEKCKKIANAMMRANQEYLKVDLKYRKRKKSSRSSDYYRSYTWHNGEKIIAKNGIYRISQ
ncbi:MAG: hypothetical protein VKL42_08445 [Snowella sp.]|nr:hypothetical protein [Snowella sp.]